MQEDSIFTRIIKGEIPCHKVYEDDRTIAFMPLHPVAQGHVLVVPKLQIDQFYDLPAEDYRALWQTVQKVAQRMREILQPKRVGLKVVGEEVPHAHVHVIAFDTVEEYDQRPDVSAEPDHHALAAMAEKLTF
jgi:histidine triad (HIT) family protein